MRTTAAVVDHQGGDFVLADVEIEEPRADEVLVRMVATGLCHTDLTMRGFLPEEMFPTVFGHEGAGVVEQVGDDVSGIVPGDHVVLSFRSCRSCARCTAGEVGYCDSSLLLNYMGMRMDGSTYLTREGSPVFGSFFGQSSLARHALAYADNCVVVDAALDLTRLAPYGCGFQTGAGTVLNVLRPRPGDSLVVFGAGAVGLSALAAVQHLETGPVVAVDLASSRLEAAAARGALTVDPADLPEGTTVVDRVKELTGGGATFAIDTTAVPEVVKQAQQALGVKGRLVVLGLGAETYELDAIDLLQTGKTVQSSIEGDADPLDFVPRLIEMTAAGTFDVDDLVTTYPAEQIAQAVADVEAGRVIKPVLVW